MRSLAFSTGLLFRSASPDPRCSEDARFEPSTLPSALAAEEVAASPTAADPFKADSVDARRDASLLS